jgi:hypothetical protein
MRIFTAIAVTLGVLVTLAAGMVIGALMENASSLDRPQWEDPDLGPSIAEGVATEQYIWLLGWNGGLVRFNRETGERLVLGTQVRDILAEGPHLWAVSVLSGGSRFEVRDLNDATVPPRSGAVSGDLLQLVQTADGVGVLIQVAVFTPFRDGLSRLALTTPLHGWHSVAATESGAIYAGRNSGEFGGALTRIDPRDGGAREIAARGEGLCEGDFNPDCDPIVGVLPDPDRPDCVIAASGAFHMGMTHGKVYRVCGDELTLTYETPNRTPLLARMLAPTDYWRDLSAPIESLTQTPDGWIAVSTGRYFRMRDGAVSEHRMPDFRHWHGLYLSDEQDGVLFVVAACCSGSPIDRYQWTVAIPVIR